MKKTIVVAALLCASFVRIGHTQPAEATYAGVLVVGQRDFKAENYEAAAKDAEKLLALAALPDQTGSALTLLGETFYRRKMYDQARE